jgi:hypothetical protein
VTDPYNTAGNTSNVEKAVSSRGVPDRPPVRTHKRTAAKSSGSVFRDFFPLWNVIALVIGAIWMATGRSSNLVAMTMTYGPLVLAIASGAWIPNTGFAILVRVLNAFLAIMVIGKLLKYAGAGIFTMNMVIVFVATALMPILNALFLRPHRTK